MNYRKLTILAAAVSLALSANAFAQDTGTQSTAASSRTAQQSQAQGSQSGVDREVPKNPSATTRDNHGAMVSGVAQQNRDRMQTEEQPMFTDIDTDGDGFISSIDLDADSTLRTEFETYDADSDSRLSSTEYSAWIAASGTVSTMEPQQFVIIDADNDGFISSTDLPTDSTLVVQFDTYDLDSDSRLSRTEYEAWLSAQADASVAATSPPGQVVSGVATTKRDFTQLDVDKDGKLSEAELALADSSIVAQLDTLDTDDDGMLSESEYRASSLAGTGFDEDFDTDVDSTLDTDTGADLDADVDIDADADLGDEEE